MSYVSVTMGTLLFVIGVILGQTAPGDAVTDEEHWSCISRLERANNELQACDDLWEDVLASEACRADLGVGQ